MKDLKHYASILSLLIMLSAVSVTSCTEDYGPEIDKLKEDVSSLKTSVDKLKEAYEGGKIISGVEPITTGIEGWKITFSDNTAITLKNGANGKDGIDGVTPYIKIDNNCNWIVSYDKGQTYSPIKDAEGNTISAKGIDGANGVSVDVQVNSEGKYEIITYLEDKNNPITVLPTPYSANPDNQISSIVEDSERGMVSITMSSGKQYNFGQALNYPTSIVLLKEEILITEENGIAEIEFYVNPSNAKITKEDIVINQIETDILKSYAESYAKPSPNYEIVSLENSVNEKGEKLKGQYKLTIKHIGESGLYGEYCTLVISTKDAQDNKIEITSEKFMLISEIPYNITITTSEGGTAEASKTQVAPNGQVTLTATPQEGYRFVNWTVEGEVVSTENPYTAKITENTEFVANFEIDPALLYTSSIKLQVGTPEDVVNGFAEDLGSTTKDVKIDLNSTRKTLDLSIKGIKFDFLGIPALQTPFDIELRNVPYTDSEGVYSIDFTPNIDVETLSTDVVINISVCKAYLFSLKGTINGSDLDLTMYVVGDEDLMYIPLCINITGTEK